jgi:archaellum component FlaF (FlaF/FlaG flagellin family)
MKKATTLMSAFAALFVLLASFAVSGCATVVRVKPTEKNLELTPTDSEGVITMVRITDSGMGARVGESADFDVIVDGTKLDTIARNQRMKLAVPNGSHTLSVIETGGLGKKGASNEEIFTANSDETLFHIYIEGGFGTVVLKQWPKE